MSLESRITQLEAEAQRVQDVSALKRLQRAYGYYVDKAAWDEVTDLFADDGSVEYGLGGVYVGKTRIRQVLYALTGGRPGLKEGQLNEQLQLQPVVHVSQDGLTAKGRWRAFIMMGQYGARAFWGEGVYENEYVNQNGVWKIQKLHWYQTFIVPYEGGWQKNKDVGGGETLSRQLPPDQPPTERYATWPGVYLPPFHYPNPVTGNTQTLPPAPVDEPPDANPAIAALQAQVRELRRRIGILRDMDQIERLISAYGYYLDKQQWSDFTDLFAENGSMEIAQRGVYIGRPSIRRAMELFGPQNIELAHLHNHIQIQPVIHVAPDGRRAWVRSRALTQLGAFNQYSLWGDGVYENELIKENGIWKLQKDHVYTTFFVPYESGWLNDGRPAPKASTKIPPDAPPTEKYETYPEVYIPPFHYKNPVTGGESALVRQDNEPGDPALAPAWERLARIAGTVQRLEDERAIENLQRSYGFYVDKALWKDAAELFAEEGTLEIGGRGVFVGKQRVLEYLTWLEPKGLTPGHLFNHIQLQPIVTVTPNSQTAKARLHFLAQVGEQHRYAMWGTGTYENDYVKENGVWKIKKLHAFFRMYTPYADGWGKTAMPNTQPEKELPPDQPPTVPHDIYPATFIPPFHYKHPVTGNG